MAGFVLNRIGRVRSDWLYFFHKNARIRYRLAIIVRSRVVNPCGRTAVPVLVFSSSSRAIPVLVLSLMESVLVNSHRRLCSSLSRPCHR